jgi:hypothetical protein
MKESIYNQILNIVCDYFGVRRYDVLMNRTNASGKQNKARTIAVYLIRKFTEDKFYTIGLFFGNDAPHAGGQYRRVFKRIHSGYPMFAEYSQMIFELEYLVYQKIDLVFT